MARPALFALAAMAALAGPAAALTEAEMQSPEARAVARLLERQGLPDEVLRSLTMAQVRQIATLLEANDAARRAQALRILGF